MGAIARAIPLFDYLATVGAMIALSIPTFWFGLVAIYIFARQARAGCRRATCYTIGNGSLLDYMHHLIAPALVLALVDGRHLEPLHARVDARGDRSGLYPHGARQGAARATSCSSGTRSAMLCCR